MRPLVKRTPIEMNKEFENMIQPYMHELKSYCVSLSKSPWDGDDLMQETLLKAYKGWLKSKQPITKAYLFRIASNAWIDGYRKRKPNEVMNPDVSVFQQEKDVVSDATFKAIEILLSELTPKQRVTVLLAEAFNYNAKEIALMIEASEGAIKAALHRARKRLKSITEDSHIFNPEEEKTLTYVTALRNGDPASIVRQYHNEMIEPQMVKMCSRRSNPCAVVQFIAGSGMSYILVTISMKNGGTLHIPFYQIELAALLSRLENLEGDIPVVA